MTMFQMLGRRFLTNQNNAVKTAQHLRFNSTQQMQTREKEIRDVRLLGTICQKPLTLARGHKLIEVKTYKPNGFYTINRALIQHPKYLHVYGDNLSIGQRIYIRGELHAKSYKNDQNQQHQSSQVNVAEMYASKCNHSESDTFDTINSMDQNNVCILARIASDIVHFSNNSVFSVFFHYTTRNTVDDEEKEKIELFSVYVHDTNLIHMLKNHVERGDRVLVKGFLNNKPDKIENGTPTHYSFMEATHILRVDRLSKPLQSSVEEYASTAIE